MTVLWANSAFAEDPWADVVVAYSPVNASAPYNDPAKALGPPLGGGPAVPNNDDVVSLGGQGGSITLKFSTPVTDDLRNPFGLDCVVYSNCFWVGGNSQRKFEEPAIIEISEDVNGNGFPDDPWYLIPGSRNLAYTGSQVPHVSEPTGQDNEGTGQTLLLVGAIRNPNTFDSDPGNEHIEYNWGYAEMNPTAAPYLDNYVRPDDPAEVGTTPRSGGGDALDIAWAIKPTGEPANIAQFHFVRITSFIDRSMGAVGQASPDIAAAADVAPDVDADGDGILDEYETRVAGTDPARPESTVLPLEIPSLEGGSSPGTILGTAQDAGGNRLRLFADQARTGSRNFNVAVDILEPAEPGGTLPSTGLVKSGAVREIMSGEPDFVAAGVLPGQITVHYSSQEIVGLDEPGLRPYRHNGGAYTQDGISDVHVNSSANLVVFRSRYAGVFLLASTAGTGDTETQGPQGTISLAASPSGEVVADPVNVVTVASGVILDFGSNPVPDGTLITVSASQGTITTADSDPGTPGVQVASSSAVISFVVEAPSTAGDALFTATSVEGSAYGELVYRFAPGPPAGPVSFSASKREGSDPVIVYLTSSVVTDQYGNVVRDGTLLTITAENADIVSGDADLTLAGHQIVLDKGRGDLILEVPDDAASVVLHAYSDPAQSDEIGVYALSPFDYQPLPVSAYAVMVAMVLVLFARRRLLRVART